MHYAFYKMGDVLAHDDEIRTQNHNLEEIANLCRPVVEYIQKKYHPYTRIIIEWDRATLAEDTFGIPFRVPD